MVCNLDGGLVKTPLILGHVFSNYISEKLVKSYDINITIVQSHHMTWKIFSTILDHLIQHSAVPLKCGKFSQKFQH